MIEAAAVDAVVINVGNRQVGREHSQNVIHLPGKRRAIEQALRRLQTDEGFSRSLRTAKCVFGDAQAGPRIAAVLVRMDMSDTQRVKLNEY